MEIEYSNKVKGKVFAYRFAGFEEKRIAEGLLMVVKKLKKKREKIINHPKNEGQATFSTASRDLYLEIECLEKIIKTFS